ncbi:unnamed protein product [marine sediment metagenome]|uniref:Uncharacterized protein n=1 Tax=marine sediment metagenome TaxID=412755 RepID=X1BKF8_9ZZZZ
MPATYSNEILDNFLNELFLNINYYENWIQFRESEKLDGRTGN